MAFVQILMALAVLQLLGGGNPLHRDGWLYLWLNRLERVSSLSRYPWVLILLVVLVPVLAIGLLISLLPYWPALAFSVLVLLYSWGRGPFAAEIPDYVSACHKSAWDQAVHAAGRQGVEAERLGRNSWQRLHEQMLQVTAYQGFERLFAVIFWFVIFGPAGALAYRLVYLVAQQRPEPGARLLWALEWMPVRLLSCSFAVTGNFVGCANRMRAYWCSLSEPTERILLQSALGALSVDDEWVQSCDVTQREIAALRRLYMRTLWFWVAVLALLTIALY